MFGDLSSQVDVPMSLPSSVALGLSITHLTDMTSRKHFRSAIATFNLLLMMTYWFVILVPHLGYPAIYGEGKTPVPFDDVVRHIVVPSTVLWRSLRTKDHMDNVRLGTMAFLALEAFQATMFLAFGTKEYPFVEDMTSMGQIFFVVGLCIGGLLLHGAIGMVQQRM